MGWLHLMQTHHECPQLLKLQHAISCWLRGLIPICVACCPAVVLILSPDFVCKKWPMWELQTALALKKTLLPILVEGMVIEDLGHLEERVYSKDETWQCKVYSKPDTKVLQEWAKTGAAVKTIVALQHVSSEQVRVPALWLEMSSCCSLVKH